MMQRIYQIVIVSAFFMLIAMPVRAALMIDFEEAGDDDNTHPAGYISLSGSSDAGTDSYSFTGLSANFGVSGTVDVTLSGTDTRFFDRETITAGDGLGGLARDFVFTPAATNGLLITLSDLSAGHYKFTGFFHDSGNNQGVADLFVDTTGTGSSFVQVIDDVAYTTGTSVAAIGKGDFAFYADGVNDVIVRVFNPNSTKADLINAFTLDRRKGLYVDFNDNDNEVSGDNDAGVSYTQTGYLSVTQSGVTSVATDVGTVDISVGPFSANPDRDRGPVTTDPDKSDLLRDFVFNQATNLDITVSNLDAGTYEFTGYFHDNVVDHGTVDILYSTDGGSTFLSGALNVDYSNGSSPDPFGFGSFYLQADGLNDVIFRITDAGSGANVINGFDLVAIPTPTALGAGVMMLGLMGLRRRSH